MRQLAKLSDDQILGSDEVDPEYWPRSAAEVHVRASEYHLKKTTSEEDHIVAVGGRWPPPWQAVLEEATC